MPAAKTGYTLYTLQIMLHYFREAKLGQPLRVLGQVLEIDAKKARLWMEMRSGDVVLAATEQLYLSVRQAEETRAAPWREETLSLLQQWRRRMRRCRFLHKPEKVFLSSAPDMRGQAGRAGLEQRNFSMSCARGCPCARPNAHPMRCAR